MDPPATPATVHCARAAARRNASPPQSQARLRCSTDAPTSPVSSPSPTPARFTPPPSSSALRNRRCRAPSQGSSAPSGAGSSSVCRAVCVSHLLRHHRGRARAQPAARARGGRGEARRGGVGARGPVSRQRRCDVDAVRRSRRRRQVPRTLPRHRARARNHPPRRGSAAADERRERPCTAEASTPASPWRRLSGAKPMRTWHGGLLRTAPIRCMRGR